MKKQIRICHQVLLLILCMILCMGAGKKGEEPETEASSSGETAQEAQQGQEKWSRPVRLGVLVWKGSDPFGASLLEAIEKHIDEISEAKGVTVEVTVEDADGDPALQQKQANRLFREGQDLVIVNLADQAEVEFLEALSLTWQTPLLFYNREPQDVRIIRDEEAFFVGTDPNEAGVMQAEIFDKLMQTDSAAIDKNGDEKINYLMFEGQLDSMEALARTEYCIRTLLDLDYDLQALAETQVADWDEETAREMMTALLENPEEESRIDPGDIEVIFCNNDAMAIGVVNALMEAGYNLPDGEDPQKHICVLGVDATEEALAYMEKGQIDGTVNQDADAAGKAIGTIALNKVFTGDYLEGTGYELADDEYSIRIPYTPVMRKK